MENNYSYAEFLKAVGKNSSSLQAERLLDQIYLDLFLKHIHREQTKERFLKLIDFALDHKDKEAFQLYSKRFLKLCEND